MLLAHCNDSRALWIQSKQVLPWLIPPLHSTPAIQAPLSHKVQVSPPSSGHWQALKHKEARPNAKEHILLFISRRQHTQYIDGQRKQQAMQFHTQVWKTTSLSGFQGKPKTHLAVYQSRHIDALLVWSSYSHSLSMHLNIFTVSFGP